MRTFIATHPQMRKKEQQRTRNLSRVYPSRIHMQVHLPHLY
ncbi:hypothetical protein ANCCAN_06145 [Ancylostoma caninum]|uniref:Uncharacterized protein n=1 Tax=Ancylostoma caninum TaxID=29170 RepID=A0A368GW55_ANCCA|nr:hypothetical protein ANCCAN_06145 [Ancylostoma caninum]